jgi:HK97 family phage portal protein
MQLTAVYACVRILSEGVASLPFQLRYPKDGGRGWTYDEKHWLYRLFARRPNEYQNPFEFREMMQGHLSLRGNAYARIVDEQRRVGDRPAADSSRRGQGRDAGQRRLALPHQATRRRDEILRREEVFHVRGLSTDGVMGINPIAAARGALRSAWPRSRTASGFSRTTARPGGWIEHPGMFKDAEQKKNFRDAWHRRSPARTAAKRRCSSSA